MTIQPGQIHPELRSTARFIPRFHFQRGNLWLVRWLANLQAKTKAAEGVQIEQRAVPSPDGRAAIPLRVYRPTGAAAPAPVLLWMHGGGYLIGRPEMSDPFLSRCVRELGITAVSVDYRLAPEHPFPTPLEDCYTALGWVAEQGRSLGMDASRIAVGGESAGGGLAAALAQLAHDRGAVRLAFQMLVYPMLDDHTAVRPELAGGPYLAWSQQSNRFGWESYLGQPCGRASAPEYAVPARRADLSGLPPAWIGVGTIDLFYAEDLEYARRLQQSGVECSLKVVPGAFHGFDVFGPQPPVVEDFRQSQLAALKRFLC